MKYYGDLHCDTLWRCYANRADLEQPHLQMKRGLPFNHLQTYAIYIPDSEEDPYRYFRAVYAYAEEMLRKYPDMVLCRTAKEIDAAFQAGKTPYLFSVEGGGFFGKDPRRNERIVGELRQKGIAFLSLCYNRGNHLAGGALSDQGLSPLGRETALQLRAAGISLDLSHLNHRSADEMLALLPNGVVATHSNAYDLAAQPRNLTKEQIKELIRQGGLVGVNFYPPFLTGKRLAKIEDVLLHIRYICDLGGEHILAFGSDFDGIDCTPADLPDAASLPSLGTALEAAWSKEQAEAFLYGNMKGYLDRYF